MLMDNKKTKKRRRNHPNVSDVVWLDTKPTSVCQYPGNIFFYYYYAAYF